MPEYPAASLSQYPGEENLDQPLEEKYATQNSAPFSQCPECPDVQNLDQPLEEECTVHNSVPISQCPDIEILNDSPEAQTTNKDEELIKNKNKHKTIFDSKWVEKFPWLMHNVKDGKDYLLCSLCLKYKKNSESPWVQNGCISIRLDKIKMHERSATHASAIADEINASNKPFGKLDIDQDSRSQKAAEAALKTLQFLIDHNLPHTTLFEPLINFLIEELECNILKPLKKAKNASYTSYVSVNEFLDAMVSVKEREILNSVKSSPFFSVLTDETTDLNNRKHMAVAISYLEDNKQKTSFLKDTMIQDGKAETIFSELCEVVDTCGGINKMCAFVSDGASAMIGKNDGVAAKLRRVNDKIIPINCMNHRLALATKDSFESQKRFLKVDEILTSIYKYYKYSSIRSNSLANAQKILMKEMGTTIKRVGFSRWLSHNEALNSIRVNYEAVLVDLENAVVKSTSGNLKGPNPESLMKFFKDYEFFQSIHFL